MCALVLLLFQIHYALNYWLNSLFGKAQSICDKSDCHMIFLILSRALQSPPPSVNPLSKSSTAFSEI